MHTSAIESQAGWNAGVSQITFHTCTPDNFTYLIPTFKGEKKNKINVGASFAQQMDPINSE